MWQKKGEQKKKEMENKRKGEGRTRQANSSKDSGMRNREDYGKSVGLASAQFISVSIGQKMKLIQYYIKVTPHKSFAESNRRDTSLYI